MVRKLFKYEFAAYSRVLIPVYIAMAGIAVLSRILQIFESDTTSSDMLIGSSVVMYVIAVLVAFGFVNIFAIVRFYKNLFSGEGYLTLTLPATAAEHIWAKLLSAMLFNLLSFVAFVISFVCITAGDICNEVFKALFYMLKRSAVEDGATFWFTVLEIILDVILTYAGTILLFYACLSIGQLFKKNRILGAVGAYFAYSIIMQILATVILATVVETDFIGDLIEFLIDKYYLVQGALAVVFFFVTRHIITNKLNLE